MRSKPVGGVFHWFAMIPRFSSIRFPVKKLRGLPFASVTLPPASSTTINPAACVPYAFTVIRVIRVRKTDIERGFATGNDAVFRLAVHADRRCCNSEGVRNATVRLTVPVCGLDALREAMGRFGYVYVLYEVSTFRVEPRPFITDGDKEASVFCISCVQLVWQVWTTQNPELNSAVDNIRQGDCVLIPGEESLSCRQSGRASRSSVLPHHSPDQSIHRWTLPSVLCLCKTGSRNL